jgi:hypothetical protein
MTSVRIEPRDALRASNRDQAVEQTIDELVVAAPTPDGYAMAAQLWTIVGERARAEALRADARRKISEIRRSRA